MISIRFVFRDEQHIDNILMVSKPVFHCPITLTRSGDRKVF